MRGRGKGLGSCAGGSEGEGRGQCSSRRASASGGQAQGRSGDPGLSDGETPVGSSQTGGSGVLGGAPPSPWTDQEADVPGRDSEAQGDRQADAGSRGPGPEGGAGGRWLSLRPGPEADREQGSGGADAGGSP